MRKFLWIFVVVNCCGTALGRGVLVPGAAPSPSRHLLQAPPAQRSPGWAQRLINYTATEAGRLSAAADINAAPFNSHSFGTFVAAARWTGTQLQATAGGLQLQAGPGLLQPPPVLSQPGPFSNIGFARVAISGGALLAPCSDDPTAPPTCPQVPTPVALIHYPDASPFLTAANAPPAYLPTPSRLAPTVVSGLVWLEVGGPGSNPLAGQSEQQLTDRLPCSPPGACIATLTIPLSRTLPAGAAYACVRNTTGIPMPLDSAVYLPLPSSNTSWWTDTSFGQTAVFEPSSRYPPHGAVSCVTSHPGAYAVVAYTIEAVAPVDQSTSEALLGTDNTKRSFKYTLEADYDSIAAASAGLDMVGEVVQLAVADITGLPLSYIQVTDIRQGSVVVSLDVWVPNSYTSSQVKAVRTAALSPNYTWLLSALAAAGIAARGFVDAVETTPAHTRAEVLGLGIGLGVGGGLLVMTAVVLVVVRRRKRAASLAAAAAAATAYKPGAEASSK